MAHDVRTDPTWNAIPRVLLVYSLPLASLAYCLHMGWVGTSRDFWVPLAFGLIVPYINTRNRSNQFWAIRDYQNRDSFPPTLGLLHATLWCSVVNLTPNAAWAVTAFAVGFLVFDYFMIRYGMLCLYIVPLRFHHSGPLRALFGFGLAWWPALGVGFALTHLFGQDTVLWIGLFALGLIGIVQTDLYLYGRLFAKRERFDHVRNVAVIGAGWAGMYATKWLTELGITVTCYEETDDIGGVWVFRRDVPGGVAKQTRATSSKHFMHASDFPLPPGLPDFLDPTDVLQFLNDYVDHFGIRDRIRLNTTVLGLDRDGDEWVVTTKTAGGERADTRFDAVVVASGPQGIPRLDVANDRLYREYTGDLIHAADHKEAPGAQHGSTVLVVGAGESAADIVAEFAAGGAEVYWSAHRGQWFADRNVGPFAADLFVASGTRALAGRYLNFEYIFRRYYVGLFIDLAWGRGGHGIRAWAPTVPYLHQFLNKSRDGILEIYRNRVKARCAPIAIEGSHVRFSQDEAPVRIDKIVLATGYKPHWPFLKTQPRRLHKLVFDLDTPTLAFVGFVRPVLGSIPSLSEAQARWMAHVFAGKASLPPKHQREVIDYIGHELHHRFYHDTSDLDVLVDQESYSTLLASYVNCDVKWLKLFFRWPKAFFHLMRVPWMPFKFELNHQDPTRRKAALENTVREGVDALHPLRWLNLDMASTFLGAFGALAVCLVLFPLKYVAAGTAAFMLFAQVLFRLGDIYLFQPGSATCQANRDTRPPRETAPHSEPPVEDGERAGVEARDVESADGVPTG